jgi:hypothetical protein
LNAQEESSKNAGSAENVHAYADGHGKQVSVKMEGAEGERNVPMDAVVTLDALATAAAGKSDAKGKAPEGWEKLPKWKRRSADRHKHEERKRRKGKRDR